MLFCTWFIAVVSNVPFHVLVEPAEAVTKRGVLDSLFVCDHEVVKGLETGHRVNNEVTVARDGADRVSEESDVHDLGEGDQ